LPDYIYFLSLKEKIWALSLLKSIIMKKTLLFLIVLLFSSRLIFAQFGTDTAGYYIERAYTELTSRDLYSVTHWILGECRSDNSEVGGEPGGYDQPAFQDLMLFDYEATNIKVETFWYRAYNIIYLCNKTIELAPETDLDEEIIELYIAEAKFIRSLVLFELAITFDSIPICTSFYDWRLTGGAFNDYDASVQIHQQPGSMAEVFSQIEQGLDDAVGVLPLRSELTGENVFRASKGAAQALMAKMYIFQSSYAMNYPGDPRFNGLTEQWELALQYAESIINSGEYELVGVSGETYNTWWDNSYLFPSETPAYRYIFTVDGNDSPESVFAAKNLTVGNGWSPYGNCDLTVYTTCREFLDSLSNIQYKGWGFNLPTQDVIDAFAEETGDEKDDPRFAVAVAYEGDSIYTGEPPDWYEMHLPDWATGTACRKFECSPQEYWNIMISFFDGPMNIPVIRYADVILWAAEAALQTGDNTKALYYINMVRQRARNSGSTGHPAELVSVTMENIMHERRLELALEGHRFYDLVRWNLANEKLDGLYRASRDQTVSFVQGTHEFLPIPEGALGTGVNARYIHNCNIYPNPVKDKLYVESVFNNPAVTIYDIYGRTILRKEFDAGSFSVNAGALPRGLYFISLETEGNHINLSFVKE
jgi:hypothetical protein